MALANEGSKILKKFPPLKNSQNFKKIAENCEKISKYFVEKNEKC